MAEWLEELKASIGATHYSDWLVVDQAMIDLFADAIHDHQYIHVDPERAAQSPFGTTVAHGFLALSLLTRLQEQINRATMPSPSVAINYGFDRVRFIHPVQSGGKVRLASRRVEIEEISPGSFQQKHEVSLEILGQAKPALAAMWLTRFAM